MRWVKLIKLARILTFIVTIEENDFIFSNYSNSLLPYASAAISFSPGYIDLSRTEGNIHNDMMKIK